MDQSKRKQNRHRLGLAVILLAACVLLTVGVTWARYQAGSNTMVSYQAKGPARVFLYSAISQTESGTSFTSFDQAFWEGADGTYSLDFAIGNSDGDTVSEEPQAVSLRLIASGGITVNMDTALFLYLPEEGTAFQGSAQQIAEGTPLYNSFGPGWVFQFRDGEGEELSWSLEGGSLSYISAQLILQDVEITETSLLQVQVDGVILTDS